MGDDADTMRGAVPDTRPPLDAVPVTGFRGVGPAMAEKLAGIGIRSAQDVLFHLPFRYQDRTRLTPIGALQPGTEAVVAGEVVIVDVVVRRRRSLLVRVADGTGSITLRFFHFGQTQVRQFERAAPGCSASGRCGAAPACSRWSTPSTACVPRTTRPVRSRTR